MKKIIGSFVVLLSLLGFSNFALADSNQELNKVFVSSAVYSFDYSGDEAFDNSFGDLSPFMDLNDFSTGIYEKIKANLTNLSLENFKKIVESENEKILKTKEIELNELNDDFLGNLDLGEISVFEALYDLSDFSKAVYEKIKSNINISSEKFLEIVNSESKKIFNFEAFELTPALYYFGDEMDNFFVELGELLPQSADEPNEYEFKFKLDEVKINGNDFTDIEKLEKLYSIPLKMNLLK